jgi:hypothetical protein
VSTKPNLPFEAQRAKFALGKSVRSKLFKELAGFNSRLKELLDTSDEINSLRTNRNTARGVASLASSLARVWEHASSLFRLLTCAWKCECSSFHRVNLMLEPRTSISQTGFQLLFLFSSNLKLPPCPTWKSLRTRVDVVDNVTPTPPQFNTTLAVQRSVSELSINGSSQISMRSSFKGDRATPHHLLKS